MNVIKFVTKTFTYFVRDNKVTSARDNKTGRFIKTYIAQNVHNKMLNAAKNFKSFISKNMFQATVWLNQLKTYFKSFGYKVSCVDFLGKHSLTLNTFTNKLINL